MTALPVTIAPIPSFLDPFASALDWDTVILAGMEVGPRVARILANVMDGDRGYEWDKKKGKGAKGETSTFVQQPAADVEIELDIWGPDGIALWYALIPLLRYDPTKGSSQAIDIFHPALIANDINAIVIDKIGLLKRVSVGRYRVTIKAHEYAPPPPVSIVSTPIGAATGGEDVIPGTPIPPVVIEARQDFEAINSKAESLGNPFAE